MHSRLGMARTMRRLGLVGAPIVALALYALLPRAVEGVPGGLTAPAAAVAAVGVLMAGWWLTEALPLSATALVPLIAFPLLNVLTMREAAAPYADPVIFLFMGGFILGLAMQRWGLHKRIALIVILIVGTSPRRIVAGFLLATALMSMWVSNSATAVMMFPIAATVVDLIASRDGGMPARQNHGRGRDTPRDVALFGTCLLLSVAYGSSIGGVGTLIGTPPNAVLAGVASRDLGINISFVQWMRLGVPLVAIMLPLAWAYMVFVAFRFRLSPLEGGASFIRGELRALGPVKRGEWIVFAVFISAAALWIFRPLIVKLLGLSHEVAGNDIDHLTDAGIAVAAALALFIIPAAKGVPAMDWRTAETLPWGVLVLFGGGLSLAGAITARGVDTYIGSAFEALAGTPTLLLLLALALGVVFLTEIASNTVVATSMMPVLIAAAEPLGVHPLLLMVPAAVAASCGFMLPVGTPPNAIVFASGRVTIGQMAKTGFALNLICAGVIVLLVWGFGLRLLGIDA